MINTFSFADHVVGFIVTEPVNQSTIKKVHLQIDEALKNFEFIDLYIEMTSLCHVELGAMVTDFKFKMKRADRFSKIAVVTDDRFFSLFCRINALFMNTELKIFTLQQRTQGLLWLSMAA